MTARGRLLAAAVVLLCALVSLGLTTSTHA